MAMGVTEAAVVAVTNKTSNNNIDMITSNFFINNITCNIIIYNITSNIYYDDTLYNNLLQTSNLITSNINNITFTTDLL